MTIVSPSLTPFFSWYLFVYHFLGFSSVSRGSMSCIFPFLGLMRVFPLCLGPLTLINSDTPLYHYISISLHPSLAVSVVRWGLMTRMSGVTNYFPGPFPCFILPSFSPYLALMPLHHHLTPQFCNVHLPGGAATSIARYYRFRPDD